MDEALFAAIESSRFAAETGVQSGFDQFLAALKAHPSFSALRTAMKGMGAKGAEAVFIRLMRLSEQQIDVRYEHPSDTAFSCYLLLLASRDRDLYETALSAVAAVPNCWWSSRIVHKPNLGLDIQGPLW